MDRCSLSLSLLVPLCLCVPVCLCVGSLLGAVNTGYSGVKFAGVLETSSPEGTHQGQVFPHNPSDFLSACSLVDSPQDHRSLLPCTCASGNR